MVVESGGAENAGHECGRQRGEIAERQNAKRLELALEYGGQVR
jgi:hypothetical protein